MSCPHTEDAVAFALHVLEPDEEARVREHLPTCAECREVVRETEETLALLGGAVEPVDPPEGLRDRILDEAARTQQRATPRQAAEPDDAPARRPAVPAPRPEPPARPRRRGRLLAAAAAALVALGAIVGLGAESARLAAERDAATARAAGLTALVEQLAVPGTAHAFLAAAAGAPAVAAVVATPEGQQMVMPVALPANPDDHVYVLWGLPSEGTPTPLGAFDVRDGSAAVQSVGSSPDGTGFAQFAISLEPGRVAPASPSDVVASGRAEI